jgi:hypothetical protein
MENHSNYRPMRKRASRLLELTAPSRCEGRADYAERSGFSVQREKNIKPMPGRESPPPFKPPQPLDEPPKPVPGEDPPEPPIKEPPPGGEPPPQRLDLAKRSGRAR